MTNTIRVNIVRLACNLIAMLLNIKHLIVLLIISLIGLSAHAFQLSDTGNMTIHISAMPSMGERYWYDIYKSKDSIKIVSSFEYSVQREPVKVIKDSILIARKKFASYDTLLDNINNTSVKSLENEEANKSWMVFDGIHFGFKIVSASGTREAHSISPREAAQPLLYKLIDQTTAIFRNNSSLIPTDGYDIIIHITVRPVFLSSAPYWVDIYRDKKDIKIVYSIQNLEKYGYTPLKLDKDSLLINRLKFASFDSLLSRINDASVTQLENREHERQVLDGVFFNFTIVSAMSQSKSAFAHSPDQSSHPLLYELLTKTFAIYRNTKPTAAWNQPKTYGY